MWFETPLLPESLICRAGQRWSYAVFAGSNFTALGAARLHSLVSVALTLLAASYAVENINHAPPDEKLSTVDELIPDFQHDCHAPFPYSALLESNLTGLLNSERPPSIFRCP